MTDSPFSETTLRYVTWKNVFVLVDAGNYRPAMYLEVERLIMTLAAQRGSAGVMTIIPSGAKQPSEEARREIARAYDRMGRSLTGSVWVVEGKGFNSAMVRATLTTISLARRTVYPTRVATSVTEGLGWLMMKRSVTGNVNIEAGVATVAAMRAPPISGTFTSQGFRTGESGSRLKNSA